MGTEKKIDVSVFDSPEPSKAVDLSVFDVSPQSDSFGGLVMKSGKAAVVGAADIAGRALSMPGAVARAGTLGTAAAFKNPKSTAWGRELLTALSGKAPSSEEYLNRMGVGEMGKYRLPEWVTQVDRYDPEGKLPSSREQHPTDITGRQAIGAISDLGMDLLASGGVGKLASIGGKNLYKSAFSKADAVLKAADKEPISELLWSRGKTPMSKAGTAETVESLIPQIAAERGVIEAPILQSNVRGSAEQALSAAQELVDRMKTSGSAKYRELGEQFQNDINAQIALGEAPAIAATPSTVTQSQIQSSILSPSGKPLTTTKITTTPGKPAVAAKPGPSYKDLMDIKSGASDNVNWNQAQRAKSDEFWQKVGGGAREESYRVANQVNPVAASQIAKKNEELSTLLSFLPKAERDAIVAAGKGNVTQIDSLLALTHPEMYAAKNVGRVIGSTGFKTAGGRLMHKTGEVMGSLSPAYTPWIELMNQKEQK